MRRTDRMPYGRNVPACKFWGISPQTGAVEEFANYRSAVDFYNAATVGDGRAPDMPIFRTQEDAERHARTGDNDAAIFRTFAKEFDGYIFYGGDDEQAWRKTGLAERRQRQRDKKATTLQKRRDEAAVDTLLAEVQDPDRAEAKRLLREIERKAGALSLAVEEPAEGWLQRINTTPSAELKAIEEAIRRLYPLLHKLQL